MFELFNRSKRKTQNALNPSSRTTYTRAEAEEHGLFEEDAISLEDALDSIDVAPAAPEVEGSK